MSEIYKIAMELKHEIVKHYLSYYQCETNTFTTLCNIEKVANDAAETIVNCMLKEIEQQQENVFKNIRGNIDNRE